tara:strand:+ start:36 stop:239 length:204 start_codon:yes stop_codon:yes gene_type:complete
MVMSIESYFDIDKRLRAIENEMEYLRETLSGCDWCCGGGDERMEDLHRQYNSLLSKQFPQGGDDELG